MTPVERMAIPAQVRFRGVVDLDDALGLCDRKEKWLELEFRDREGNRTVPVRARLASFEMRPRRKLPLLTIELEEVVLSVPPATQPEEHKAVTSLGALMRRAKREKGKRPAEPPRRFSREEREQLYAAIRADRAQNMTFLELSLKHGVSKWFVQQALKEEGA